MTKHKGGGSGAASFLENHPRNAFNIDNIRLTNCGLASAFH
jgi:hypothetical protein